MKNNCREMVYLFFFTLVEVYLGASGSIREFHSFIGCIFTRDGKCVGNIDETDFSTATALSRGRKRSVCLFYWVSVVLEPYKVLLTLGSGFSRMSEKQSCF